MIEFLDPEKDKSSEITRKTVIFNRIMLGTAVMVIILEVTFSFLVPQEYARWLFITLSYTAITAILIFLNKKGHFFIVSILFISFMTLLLFGLAWTGGGIKAPVVFTIPLLVLVAGLLLGWEAGLITGVIIILLSTAMVIAEHLGIISGRTLDQQPVSILIIFIFTICLLAILQYLSTTDLNKALNDAHEELKRRKRTEKELQISESHIRSISKNITDGMIYQVIIRPDGTRNFTYLSDSVIQLYGITPAEAMNNADLIYSRIHEADFPRVKELEDRAATSLSVFKAEFRALNPSGSLRWSSCISNPTLMHDGSVKFDGIEFVITEHKITEERLAASEAKYRFISENTEDVIWSINLKEGKYTYISPSVEKLRGYKPEEVMEQTMADSLTPESYQKTMEKIKEAIARRKPGDLTPRRDVTERQQIHKDGSIIDTEISSTMFFSDKGEPTELIGVTRNITERKKAEAALQQSELRYRSLFETAYDAIFLMRNEYFIDCNPAALSMFHCTRDDIKGKSPIDFSPELQPDGQRSAEKIKNILHSIEKKTYGPFEWRHRREDGTSFDTEVSLSKITLNNETLMQAMVHDITERKEAEEKTRASLNEKETLLRELYHRTKNNMQVISAMVNLSTSKLNDLDAVNIIREIDSKIHTMSLVHKKLYESRDLSHINLKEYLDELTSYLVKFHKPLSKNITIAVQGADIFLLIDIAIPLGMVLNELINNAMKHAFPGKNEGAIHILLNHDDENTVIITVADNGVGMPDGFDINYNDTLGLQTAAAIVEQQLQGDINFKSDRDRGTTWIITFKNDLYGQRV